jgi:hypothetical protein
MNRRFAVAMVMYGALAIGASFQLDGRPRIAVWLVLGLFVTRTLLAVLKQRAD